MPVCSTRPKTINRKTEQQQAAYACAPPLAGPWDAMEPIRRMCRWIAALSARVGSIGDNRTGGWHGYRALKAALNMIIRNLAIETARRTPETLCVGLHPGTVDTALSKPFQANVRQDGLFTADHAAACLLSVINNLTPPDSGTVLAWDGTTVPW